jgi:hypothetical protein
VSDPQVAVSTRTSGSNAIFESNNPHVPHSRNVVAISCHRSSGLAARGFESVDRRTDSRTSHWRLSRTREQVARIVRKKFTRSWRTLVSVDRRERSQRGGASR